jgi:hypothetical protein
MRRPRRRWRDIRPAWTRWAWGATGGCHHGGGRGIRLAPGASLFLNASGELGKAGKRESVTGGVRFRL